MSAYLESHIGLHKVNKLNEIYIKTVQTMVVEINGLHIDYHMHTRAFIRESPNEHVM